MMWDPKNICEKLVKAGDDYSDKNSAADLLEESRKVLLAQIQIGCPEKSMAAKEMHALADKRYEEHIRLMVEARREANRARVRWESARVYVELLRTKEANERATNKFST